MRCSALSLLLLLAALVASASASRPFDSQHVHGRALLGCLGCETFAKCYSVSANTATRQVTVSLVRRIEGGEGSAPPPSTQGRQPRSVTQAGGAHTPNAHYPPPSSSKQNKSSQKTGVVGCPTDVSWCGGGGGGGVLCCVR